MIRICPPSSRPVRSLLFCASQPLPLRRGTAAAAVAHIRMLAARVRLVNVQLKETSRKLRRAVRTDRKPWSKANDPDARAR